jgi:DNA (cytosine-5)-methyltransferase 1
MNVIDLFSGIGGFSLGLERAGMRTVAFCEIDSRARKVLAHHWPAIRIFEDVRTIDYAGIDADVICGGFPCQDISLAGEGAGLAGERSGLWRELLRAICVVRPAFAIVENVAALLGRGMDVVLGDLAEIGYDAEWHCIRASDLGAPHERDRVWVIAYPVGSRGSRLVTSADIGTPGPWRLRSQEDLQYLTNPPFERGDSWPQPLLRRVDDGLPGRVDRLHCIGNAIVPQIAEAIGRAIMTSALSSHNCHTAQGE